jgi:TMEM175 potassium channel family protein
VGDTANVSETTRTEAFSDGVLAIAITLLVLDLRVPARATLHGSLARALSHEWPALFAYVTSFLVIGIIWVNHHAVFRLLAAVDRVVMFLNLLLLMCVAAIPFTTALLSEYLTATTAGRTAALIYSLVMLAMSLCFAMLYRYIAYRPVLLADGVDPAAVRGSIVRFTIVGISLYLVTIAVALINPVACLALHLAIGLYYCFEQTGRAPGAAATA